MRLFGTRRGFLGTTGGSIGTGYLINRHDAVCQETVKGLSGQGCHLIYDVIKITYSRSKMFQIKNVDNYVRRYITPDAKCYGLKV